MVNISLVKIYELKAANPNEIDISELPDKKIIGTLLLEQHIKYPGDIITYNNKSYITVEKVNHYFLDGDTYKFAKTILYVKPLDKFC